MDDLISREAVVNLITDSCYDLSNINATNMLIDKINEIPSVELKTGVWQESTIPERYVTHRCSNCGYGVKFSDLYSYCPECGAKMEVENVGY